jgi:hypothetical protein
MPAGLERGSTADIAGEAALNTYLLCGYDRPVHLDHRS